MLPTILAYLKHKLPTIYRTPNRGHKHNPIPKQVEEKTDATMKMEIV